MPSAFIATPAPIILSKEDFELPAALCRKRPTPSTDALTAKKTPLTPIDDITPFVSSKKTSPRIFAGKKKSGDTLKVLPFSEDKENKRTLKKTSHAQKRDQEKKLTMLLEKNRSRPTQSTRLPPKFSSTMTLLQERRDRNLQEAKDSKENGLGEPAKKKKKVMKRDNYWNQFK